MAFLLKFQLAPALPRSIMDSSFLMQSNCTNNGTLKGASAAAEKHAGPCSPQTPPYTPHMHNPCPQSFSVTGSYPSPDNRTTCSYTSLLYFASEAPGEG